MTKRRLGILLLAGILLSAAGFYYFVFAHQDRAPGRYGEIHQLIMDNRHLGRHFTLATNTDTIKTVRKQVTVTDVPILLTMLGDEKGAVAVAAGGLLVMLGAPGEAALREASQSKDVRTSMHADTALIHLNSCRDPKITNLDREMCP